MATAQQAARLDLRNGEVSNVVKSVRAVASARLSGNSLFKASKFTEACIAYSEGLEYDAYNSILLCNRAACRSKLGQYEKAVEDCTVALSVQPNYSKARLRRAHCNAEVNFEYRKWLEVVEIRAIVLISVQFIYYYYFFMISWEDGKLRFKILRCW
jgi:tetratricopeptide (TPR) repeat protein